MDLHSGLPFWIVKNKLYNYHNPVRQDIHTHVAIIGSGITGSLVAHELCKKNIECIVIDKRSLGLGSTAASTAQLQYEIDVPLTELVKKVGEKHAVQAYHDCLRSINDIADVLEETETKQSFSHVPTFLLASKKSSSRALKEEYKIRKQHHLPVDFIEKKELQQTLGTTHHAALYNDSSAQMDCYAASTGILDYYRQRGKIELFSNTRITDYKKTNTGYKLSTANGQHIYCSYVVIAAGFEAGDFLPRRVMRLLSTYALVSQPIDEEQLWYNRALLWETSSPYLYMRTTSDNRIIIGGEDLPFSSPNKRDDFLRKKSAILEKKFKKWFPKVPLIPEMSWCGTFSSTDDGLPFIGPWPGSPNMLFTLGYGGNGITFSMIGAQVIANMISGKKDTRTTLYGFDRKK
ncbi:NAD(P)/FAD-dependent oxidoreductase [Sphingobacterium sp. LRF_L2]|uniref:NAD(P)/FAD-dependent oxidoreductase n=1 Tax=Sphingobacterium sp. LRF_L2 TaxID=3369421 RepID=UPI003F5D64ED